MTGSMSTQYRVAEHRKALALETAAEVRGSAA